MANIVKSWFHHDYFCQIAKVGLDEVGYHYCGYVRIKEDHQFFGKHYDCEEIASLPVHGGVTFAGKLSLGNDMLQEGWFIGFDCMHYGDAPHGHTYPELWGEGHAWTIEEVFEETNRLADYVAEKANCGHEIYRAMRFEKSGGCDE